ncbi:hypothetical protein TNCV_3912961 [Trichonephila clavipes]|nr:hypothetical protein TNCV_3912961 [Trichonephila clavipes]
MNLRSLILNCSKADNSEESQFSDPKRKFADLKLHCIQTRNVFRQSDYLKPIFEEEIPALYGKDIDEVEFQKDKTFSPPSKLTADCLAKKESKAGIKCIPLDEMLVKSTIASAMNF